MVDYDQIAENVKGVLPEEKEYSVVQIDTMKSPDDPDCATKIYEVDDPEEAVMPDGMGDVWIIYDRDGNAVN